ncbi:GNAT family N-acetyltransferase [Planctomonas psychrotolerans]|uniref:GNAT family N-acetyltransferase n=1 Tax=Planctomonas psychrotolerans TaxID=2528712 RepID=UPI001D0D7969|nr:GNAT family N-acetyltransferase [Planctomonas psychrotolerans]
MQNHSITVKTWGELTTDELFAFLRLRTTVFFLEQRIDEEELDDADFAPTTQHLWIDDDRGVAAYLRLVRLTKPEHRGATLVPGRVVVRADRRGEGLARRLFDRVLEQHGSEPLVLHSQAYVAPLYASLGFEPYGDEYLEAGIPHISMYRAGRTPATAS